MRDRDGDARADSLVYVLLMNIAPFLVLSSFVRVPFAGISIIFAAGDDGIGSVDTRAGIKCTQAHPNFPSSSPWVTSVGGTQLAPRRTYDSWTEPRGESVCSASTGCVITTGGGFSHLFTRPAYQDRQVQAYLDRSANGSTPLVPPNSWFNRDGRGYPDISTISTNYEIIVGGRTSRTGGTSASAPVVAAMISLWNEKLIAEGKPQLGFINPWLYSIDEKYGKEVFNDVVSGQNTKGQAGNKRRKRAPIFIT